MKHHPSITHPSRVVYTILLIGFIYTLHSVLPVYVNSSFLGLFTNEQTIGILYIVGSMLTIIGLFSIGKILERFGNYKTSLILIVIQLVLSYAFITAESFWIIAAAFILSTVVVTLIGLNLDVFLETYSDIRHIGGIRGLFMGVNNIAWILAPLIGASLIAGIHYRNVYMAAFGILFFLFYFIWKNLKGFKDPHYGHFALHETLAYILRKENLSKLFAANVILNTFYAWMVIYIPIHLHETLGFSWDEIGIILTIMLLPFVIFQYPAGRLADRGWGEKKIMNVGFIIMGLSTIALGFITSHNVLVWAIALFMTRVGASIAEVMIEAYFFKKVKPEDADVLTSFRVTRFIAYILAPAITAVGLYYSNAAGLFVILGIIVLLGLRFTLTIEDVV
ncbi:MAG: MFS transporter [bacterium]